MNGLITRTQDATSVKHQEDAKPNVDQNNFQNHFRKEIDHHMKAVNSKDKNEYHQDKYDAKEKGSNQYSGQQNKKKKEDKQKEKVAVKTQKGFDMRI